MAGCLYDCLKEAHLDSYHGHFVRHGIIKCDGLAVLSMQDYSRFGITRMEDRVRLFKLVQIVKSVHAEGRYFHHDNPRVPSVAHVASVEGQLLQDAYHQVNQPCSRGQAFVQYMRTKQVPRGSGYNHNVNGALNEVKEVKVTTQQAVPITRPSRSSSINQLQHPPRSKSADVVKYRPETGSPIFKCRKVLTFSDSESDDEIPDSEIRQKVLSTISKTSTQKYNSAQDLNLAPNNLHQGNPGQQVMPTTQSFFLDLGGSATGFTNKSNQYSWGRKTSTPNEGLFVSHQNINSAFQKGQASRQSEFEINFHKTPESGHNNKRNILRKEIVDRGNVSQELLTIKSTVEPSDSLDAPREKQEPSPELNDEETDEYFDLPRHGQRNESALILQKSSTAQHPQGLQTSDFPSQESGKEIVKSDDSEKGLKPECQKKEPSPEQYNPLKYSPKQKAAESRLKRQTGAEGHINLISIPVKSGIFDGVANETRAASRSAFMMELWPPGVGFQRDRVIGGVNHAYFPKALPSSPPVREPVVERVVHNSDYNYGLPKAPSTPGHRRKGHKGDHDNQRIRVCIRKRPLTRREQKRQEVDIVNVDGSDTVTVDETKVAVDLAKFIQQHVFVFDEVFSERCSNEDVYNSTAKPLVKHIFKRGCATCFAFGQTGAGKTYTLMGTSSVPGLYRLAAIDMFSLVKSGQHGSNLHIWLSYYEIYCGQLYDLLNKRKKLHVRENGRQRVCVAGLMETRARNVDDVVQVVQYGNSIRSTGSTGVNPNSSRSHSILQLEVRDSSDQRLGRISFIDLAGSERAADVTEFDRQTRIEGAEINQSLLALKECIRSLDQESKHTPYRQSKLTHILRDSFVGNSRTCMIANISPSLSACENTLNTLRYADRVKELRRNPPSNQSPPAMTTATPSTQPMNPSLFHPSNIQFSSTPKVTESSQQPPLDLGEALHDAGETPIRGHKLRKSLERQRSRDIASHSTSPSKVNPFEFNIEKSGAIISITTSMNSREPKECRSRDSSPEKSKRHSSVGSRGTPQTDSLKLSQQGDNTPRSTNTTRTSKSYRSKKTSEGNSSGVNENSPSSEQYKKSNNSIQKSEGHYSGRSHHGYQKGTDGDIGQGGKVTQPLSKSRLLAQDTGHIEEGQIYSRTSIHAARQALASSSKPQLPSQDQLGKKPTAIDDHRQILSHLDNIMDRAKVAINKSSDGTDQSDLSPQLQPTYNQQSQGYTHKESGELPFEVYNLHSSKQRLQRSREKAVRPENSAGSSSQQSQTEEEGIAHRSLIYDLQMERERLLTGARETSADREFMPLPEDTENTEDYEEVKHDQSDGMPDGHHYSPQQGEEECQEGKEEHSDLGDEEAVSLEEESSEEDTEESSGESSASIEQEEVCSCSTDLSANRVQGGMTARTFEKQEGFQHFSLPEELRTQSQVSQGRKVSPSSQESLGFRTGKIHDITPHVEKIRNLLSSDVTANLVENQGYLSSRQNRHPQYLSKSAEDRVPRLSSVMTETFHKGLDVIMKKDNTHMSGSWSDKSKQAQGAVHIMPQAEGFLESLAGMKYSKKILDQKLDEPTSDSSPKSAFKINPALASMSMNRCSSDNQEFSDCSPSDVRKTSSDLTYQNSKLVYKLLVPNHVRRSDQLNTLDSRTDKEYCSDVKSVSDSGLGTRQESTDQEHQCLRSQDESDYDVEVVSQASTLDDIVSLSVNQEDIANAKKGQVQRMFQKESHYSGEQIQQEAIAAAPVKPDVTSLETSVRSSVKSQSLFLVSAGEKERAGFEPIQPYPVSDKNTVVAPTAITKAVPKLQGLQSEKEDAPQFMVPVALSELSGAMRTGSEAKPEDNNSDSDNDGCTPRSMTSTSSARSSGSAIQRAQSLLLEAHEDQLAEITTMCKQEMKLLMAVKLGDKTFSEYVQQLQDLLSSKAAAISTLRAQIAEFNTHSAANTPRN